MNSAITVSLQWVIGPCRGVDLTIFSDDPKGVKPMGKIATQTGARTGAVDEKTGKVYLAAADYLPAAGKERPQIKPGSVVLLQIDP